MHKLFKRKSSKKAGTTPPTADALADDVGVALPSGAPPVPVEGEAALQQQTAGLVLKEHQEQKPQEASTVQKAGKAQPEQAQPTAKASTKQRKRDVGAAQEPHPDSALLDEICYGDGGVALFRSIEEHSMKLKQQAAAAATDTAVAHEVSSQHLKVSKAAKAKISSQASAVSHKRLMREFRNVCKSKACANGDFSVELAGDNIYEWDVKMRAFDKDSPLAKDLAALTRIHGIDCVWTRFSFPKEYPFVPPFVRVMAPLVQGGFVVTAGAVCMELLTPDGWAQGYRMEAVIVQAMAAIAAEETRIVQSTRRPFEEQHARAAYDYLVKSHAKHGWKANADKS
eukprot:m.362529 g.362529  ORF g.362529 m.362529 type:complete len:340 (+) comp20607_c0_seq1:177-1196(+)